jgi:hypothetical protein
MVLQPENVELYNPDAYHGAVNTFAMDHMNALTTMGDMNAKFQPRVVRPQTRKQGNVKRGQNRSNHPPVIKARSFPCCTQVVLQFLRAEAKGNFGYLLHYDNLGWKALQQVWNIIPADLDSAALSYLHTKPHYLQQHILLALCAADLARVKKLSAFMSCVVHKLERPFVVCLGFLAGCCDDANQCPFLHPAVTTGWRNLWEKWRVGWQDFDYLVLNSLFQKHTQEQEDILEYLANMKLKNINNLSAVLSTVIQQHDKNPNPTSPRTPKNINPRQANILPEVPEVPPSEGQEVRSTRSTRTTSTTSEVPSAGSIFEVQAQEGAPIAEGIAQAGDSDALAAEAKGLAKSSAPVAEARKAPALHPATDNEPAKGDDEINALSFSCAPLKVAEFEALIAEEHEPARGTTMLPGDHQLQLMTFLPDQPTATLAPAPRAEENDDFMSCDELNRILGTLVAAGLKDEKHSEKRPLNERVLVEPTFCGT